MNILGLISQLIGIKTLRLTVPFPCFKEFVGAFSQCFWKRPRREGVKVKMALHRLE